MSTEEIEDADLYHVDFTTASEWEVFIARIEEIIQEWKLYTRSLYPPKLKISSATWHSRSEEVSFAGRYMRCLSHLISLKYLG